jgi:hypothetical protein
MYETDLIAAGLGDIGAIVEADMDLDAFMMCLPRAPIGHLMRMLVSDRNCSITHRLKQVSINDDPPTDTAVDAPIVVETLPQRSPSAPAVPSADSPTSAYTEASDSEQLWLHDPLTLMPAIGVTYACHYLGTSELPMVGSHLTFT